MPRREVAHVLMKSVQVLCALFGTLSVLVLFQRIPHTCRGASLTPDGEALTIRSYEKECAGEYPTFDRRS